MTTVNEDSPKQDLVIFVPVHKNYVYLSHMIETVKSSRYNIKFYIVNNGSDYDTNRYCKILQRRENFTVEHHKEALGVSRVWNRCLDIAIEKGYELVVITNSDILFHKSCIDLVVRHLENNPDQIISCPVDIKKVQDVVSIYPFLEETEMNKFTYDKDRVNYFKDIVDSINLNQPDPAPIADIIDYSCFAVRPKKLVETVGYFDENFLPAYWEDTDMHWRLAAKGIKSFSILNAPMLHISSRSLKEGGFKNDAYNPNAFYFIKKFDTQFRQNQIIKDSFGKFITVRTFSATDPYDAFAKKNWGQIYDCFVFEGDLDLLELRLQVLSEIVDFFVIVESSIDAEGKAKPLYLKENRERFLKYLPKIKRLIVQDLKDAKTPKDRDALLTRALLNGLKNAKPSDMIILSDIAEIPEPRKIQEFRLMDCTKVLTHKELVEKVNLARDGEQIEGSRFCSLKVLDENHNNDLASLRTATGFVVKNGGWVVRRDTNIDILKAVKAEEIKPVPLDHRHWLALREGGVPDSLIWNSEQLKHKGSRWVDGTFEVEE